jgi:molecular chaperone GrpE
MKPENDIPEPPSGSGTGPNATEPGTDMPDADADGGAAAVAALQAEVAELKDRLLRMAADMENARKRNERQLEDAHKYAVAGFARDVLSVADNLQRALAAVPRDRRDESELISTLLGGVEAVEKSLLSILEKHNVTRIEPLGEPFDPNRHEAVFEVADGDYPAGTVAQVLQPGYLLNDRLLRPAMVGVAKEPAGAPSSGVDTTA